MNSYLDSALILLNAGADPNAGYNHLGDSVLHHAASKGPRFSPDVYDYDTAVRLVIALLDAGADPNATDHRSGWTPLHSATHQGGDNVAIVKALLDAGADPNAKALNHRDPAYASGYKVPLNFAYPPYPESVAALLNAGAEPIPEMFRTGSASE